MTRAGAVAKEGMGRNRGLNTTASRNSTPVVMLVRPVRPPSVTPEALSTNVVVVEVPSTAPAQVAMESASSAPLMWGSLPSSSSMSALEATPIRVPRVSNRSTKRNENMTAKKFRMPTPLKSTLNTWPKVLPRAEKSKLMNEVGMTEYMPASGLGM